MSVNLQSTAKNRKVSSWQFWLRVSKDKIEIICLLFVWCGNLFLSLFAMHGIWLISCQRRKYFIFWLIYSKLQFLWEIFCMCRRFYLNLFQFVGILMRIETSKCILIDLYVQLLEFILWNWFFINFNN